MIYISVVSKYRFHVSCFRFHLQISFLSWDRCVCVPYGTGPSADVAAAGRFTNAAAGRFITPGREPEPRTETYKVVWPPPGREAQFSSHSRNPLRTGTVLEPQQESIANLHKSQI